MVKHAVPDCLDGDHGAEVYLTTPAFTSTGISMRLFCIHYTGTGRIRRKFNDPE